MWRARDCELRVYSQSEAISCLQSALSPPNDSAQITVRPQLRMLGESSMRSLVRTFGVYLNHTMDILTYKNLKKNENATFEVDLHNFSLLYKQLHRPIDAASRGCMLPRARSQFEWLVEDIPARSIIIFSIGIPGLLLCGSLDAVSFYLEDVIEYFIEAMPKLIHKQVQLFYLKVPMTGHHSCWAGLTSDRVEAAHQMALRAAERIGVQERIES